MRTLVIVILGLIACDAGRPPAPPAPAPKPVTPDIVAIAPLHAEVAPKLDFPELPVERPVTKEAAKHEPGAIILIIDRSGSMQGSKLEAAKDSARVVVEVLEPTDEVGIITFDSEATVVSPLQKASAHTKIEAAIQTVTAGGGTNIFPGLKEAVTSLRGSKLKRKHIILLTDGEAPTDGIAELLNTIEADHITVSTIGVAGADRNLLAMISDAGRGRLYMVEDIGALPRIFMKEVKEAFKR